jgi:hypothetical protein
MKFEAGYKYVHQSFQIMCNEWGLVTMQAGVVDILKASKWWKASQGRDHVIVMHHPNAFRFYSKTLSYPEPNSGSSN